MKNTILNELGQKTKIIAEQNLINKKKRIGQFVVLLSRKYIVMYMKKELLNLI